MTQNLPERDVCAGVVNMPLRYLRFMIGEHQE